LGEARVRTAAEPTRLRLTPENRRFKGGNEDLAYVLVEAMDKGGNLCPLAMNSVRFSVQGPASIAGVANGDHHFPAEYVTDTVDLFCGNSVVVLRSTDQKGRVLLEATTPGLEPARVWLRVQ